MKYKYIRAKPEDLQLALLNFKNGTVKVSLTPLPWGIVPFYDALAMDGKPQLEHMKNFLLIKDYPNKGEAVLVSISRGL